MTYVTKQSVKNTVRWIQLIAQKYNNKFFFFFSVPSFFNYIFSTLEELKNKIILGKGDKDDNTPLPDILHAGL